MDRVVVAALVRNEASRFWRSALETWRRFADEIVVLDDGSADDTAKIAEEEGCIVEHRYERAAWGEEAPARASLWDLALDNSQDGDWIFVLDADMTPANDPREMLHDAIDAVSFRLFDIWGRDKRNRLVYRADGFWQAHVHPRVWCVRRPAEEPEEGWTWSERGIHTGHFPSNLSFGRILYAPLNYSLLHFAYSTEALRWAKAAQYESVAEQLTAHEQQHAASIMHPKPTLMRVPFAVEYDLEMEE